MAVCTASVVTPAPPTAGRKVKICASVVSLVAGVLATRAQARTSSTGDTGLTRKSATRICIRRRATLSSKLCVIATTGGQLPMRSIRRSSASNSAALPASMSTTTTVAPSSAMPSAAPTNVPAITSSAICGLALNVARTESSNAGSAVRTTTFACIPGVVGRPARMFRTRGTALLVSGAGGAGGSTADRGTGRRLRATRRHPAGAQPGRRRQCRVGRRIEGDRLGDLVDAIALHRPLHTLAVEREVLVVAVRRPRIDHLLDLIGGHRIASTERNRFAPVEVDVGATGKQCAEHHGGGNAPLRAINPWP